jgi:hypothetical protein
MLDLCVLGLDPNGRALKDIFLFPRDFSVAVFASASSIQLRIMLFGGRYFGLKGTKLNVAIGVIAGLDFL